MSGTRKLALLQKREPRRALRWHGRMGMRCYDTCVVACALGTWSVRGRMTTTTQGAGAGAGAGTSGVVVLVIAMHLLVAVGVHRLMALRGGTGTGGKGGTARASVPLLPR